MTPRHPERGQPRHPERSEGSADLLSAARSLLTRTDPSTAGLWPRAAALLARQALEETLDDFWRSKSLPLATCSTRPQLICLPSYVDPDLAGRVNHTWSALTRACHHHPYELAPSVEELQVLLASVNEFLTMVAATEGAAAGPGGISLA